MLGVLGWALTRIHNLPLVLQCCRQDISTVSVCGTELWVVYRDKGERWGLLCMLALIAPTNGMPHDPPPWTVVGQGGDLTTGLRFNFYFPPFCMTYWKPTIRGVFQLSAHHTSICVIPKVNTDGPPTTIDTQLNSSIWPEVTTTISDKAQCATSTWSYGSVSIIVITAYFLYAKDFQHLMIENQNLCFINS